jgi:hypothetical protein
MIQRLNPGLYWRLERCFGNVRVENEGDPGYGNFGIDPVTLRPRSRGRGGEEYIVTCPFCADRRGHLYINYRYGLRDPETGSDNTGLAHCFRRDCLSNPANRGELADRIFSLVAHDFGNAGRLLPASEGEPFVRHSTTIEPPGDLVPLTELPEDHRAAQYMTGRGFDLAELGRLWGVAYCVVPCAYTPMVGRVYVPIRMGGRLVGWQGRYAGELDWGATGKPKYYNAPGMRKGQLLYNYDQALRQPCVVVVEGVTDVWRVGLPAVALFGKSATQEQARHLAAGWHGKPVVILLDADATEEAEKVRHQVAALHPGQVVVVTLPDGLDPGSCPRDELWDFLRAEAKRQGANLPADSAVAVA